MKNNKISVIVAVYNTEKYVKKCIESLLNQTYDNIEIVVVEDCSTDNSKKVIQKYKDNKKIKLLYNEKNSGLSYSRNRGLKEATGEYIGYIDSDDYVEKDYFEKLINSIVKNKSEIAICDMKIVYENTNNEQISKCCNYDEFNLVNVINNGLAASACNKLFKRELIEKYKFSEGKVNEDIAVVIPTLCNAKKISYAENSYYYYVQRGGSIQNSGFSDKRFDIFYGVDLTLERIKKNKNFDNLRDALIFNQIIVLLIYVITKEKKFFKRRKILKKFNELSSKYNIRTNKNFLKFLESSGRKHKIYYKRLFKFTCDGKYLLANFLIMTYEILFRFKKKNSVIKNDITIDDLIKKAKKQSSMRNEKIKVSVVIPNYNYEKFMYQRLYSVLAQNYKIHEILILDDCSKDNSRDLILKIENQLKSYINIKHLFNHTNSGTAFKQWKKGFENITGDYVWIAEADDYCEQNLLRTLIQPILNDANVLISYADTSFINADGSVIIKTIKPEIDIMKTGHWNNSYINDGIEELKNYSFLNCTLANVSSCIIKNGNYDKYLEESCEYKQAGDWVFYVNVMKNGKIAFSNKVLNYYRVHGNNVSSTMNRKKHIDEINKIHSKFIKEFNLGKFQKNEMKKRILFLKNVWKVK